MKLSRLERLEWFFLWYVSENVNMQTTEQIKYDINRFNPDNLSAIIIGNKKLLIKNITPITEKYLKETFTKNEMVAVCNLFLNKMYSGEYEEINIKEFAK